MGPTSRSACPVWLRLCVALWALLWVQLAAAAPPPPYLVPADISDATITMYSEYLSDPRGSLTLEQVRALPNAAFHPATRNSEFLGFSNDIWWIRVALYNPATQPRSLLLSLLPGRFAELDFHRPDGDHYRLSESGHLRQPPWGDVAFRTATWRVELPPHSTQVFYLRVRPDRAFNYALSLSTAESFLTHYSREDALLLSLGGLLGGLALFTFAQLLKLRQRVYAYYTLYLTGLASASLAEAGLLGFQFLFWPGLSPHLEAFGGLLALAACAAFTRSFLDTRYRMPWADGWLILMLLLAVLGALVGWWLPASHALQWMYLLCLFGVLLFTLVSAAGWIARVPGAGLYLLARLPLLTAVLCMVLITFGVVPLELNAAMAVMIGGVFEALLFAVGLADKSRQDLRRHLLDEQAEALSKATWRARSDTLSRLSHEIRTPMSGILGMAEILQDTPLTPNQRDCVQAIETAGGSLLRMLNDVVEYARLEHGHTEVEQVHFDLQERVMEAVELFRERAAEKQVELIAHVHSNVALRVAGDPGRLKQILINVIGAGIRHAQPGELLLDISRAPTGQLDELRFELEGSALGVHEVPFAPLVSAQDDALQDSAALGLTIARQLVDILGGRCGLRHSRTGVALWFTLSLPAVEQPARAGADYRLLHDRSLLVVDDSSTVTRVIRQQALSWGMRVTACHDPREALASLRSQINLDDPYDLVLLDQNLPGMSGLQLAARILEDPQVHPSPRLLMLTGVNDSGSEITARSIGIHGVLLKPVSGAVLRETLAGLLGAASATQQPEAEQDSRLPDPGLRLLVAEDHQLSQKVIRGMLAKLGLDAHIVSNGREAVDAMQRGRYDMILMDCEMPDMDGFEAARALRSWEREQGRKPVPIIALTAHILREHRERSLGAGMNAHIAKPIELDVLRRTIVQFSPTEGSAAYAPDESGLS